MPEERKAAEEHALLADLTEPLSRLPPDPPAFTSAPDFPIVLRGYDRVAVDDYVRRTSRLVADLQATGSPDAAVRRALEQVGEQIAGILQRAHDTASEITAGSRREAEDRLIEARREAQDIVAAARARLEELDVETDRVWAERERLVEETRALAQELLRLTEGTAPAAVEPTADPPSLGAGPVPVAALPSQRPDAPYDFDPTAEDLEPTAEDLEPTAEDLEPTAEDLEPTAEDPEPTAEDPDPGRAGHRDPAAGHSDPEGGPGDDATVVLRRDDEPA